MERVKSNYKRQNAYKAHNRKIHLKSKMIELCASARVSVFKCMRVFVTVCVSALKPHSTAVQLDGLWHRFHSRVGCL